MSDEKKSKPGRVVMLEDVPKYRGCVSLRKGTIQRLDKEATKDLLRSGKAEVYEDREARLGAEEAKKEADAKRKALRKPKPAAPKPEAAKEESKQ